MFYFIEHRDKNYNFACNLNYMPIKLTKTPKEILLEKAGIPHLKRGKKVKGKKRPYTVEDMKNYIIASKLKDNPVKKHKGYEA